MGEAIGQMLPSAVGIAISPLPIVAVVLMLVTERGRTNGPAFVIGWLLGIVILGGTVLVVAGGAGATDEDAPATWVELLKLAIGILLLLLAVQQWRKRPQAGAEPDSPQWMGALDSFGPLKAAGAGAALSSINPKNLLLVIAGDAAIAQTGIAGGQQAVALIIFALIASIGVITPVAIYFVMGDRAHTPLNELKDWMVHNNAVIMALLLVILGTKLVGDAIAGLS